MADVISIQNTPRRGGARPGAGRPFEGGPRTKPVQLPIRYATRSIADELVTLHELIGSWDAAAADASPTSPRWEKLRAFLADARAQCPQLFRDIPY